MTISAALDALSKQNLDVHLRDLQKGIEKESLRIDENGMLALTPHPKSLGAPLTHAHITTDYAEPLLELVTDVYTDPAKLIGELDDLHSFIYQNIGNEALWVNSMPCLVKDESSIPIARYGNSNSAKMRETYRSGLGFRYGRIMQIIAGIHFNFSLPKHYWQALADINGSDRQAIQTSKYLALIRNFHRHAWLILYLFGASPALCKGFLRDKAKPRLQPFDMHSIYAPYATTLRLSDLGYSNQNQSRVEVNYNHLSEFTKGLRAATSTPVPEYEKIGVNVEGHYRQLNSHILQIENEFYSVIRPKPKMQPGQRPAAALEQNGIDYIEVRCMDLNPWLPAGIDEQTIRFLECFLLYCHLLPSPELTREAWRELKTTRLDLCYEGRNPEFSFAVNGKNGTLREHGAKLMTELKKIAEFLDSLHGHSLHSEALGIQSEKLQSPTLLPSAKIIQYMRENDVSFYEYAMQQAQNTTAHYQQRELPWATNESMTVEAKQSWQALQELENNDTLSFEQYLQAYFSQ